MSTPQQIAIAHVSGRDAYSRDEPFLSNPYDRAQLDLWQEWRNGYLTEMNLAEMRYPGYHPVKGQL